MKKILLIVFSIIILAVLALLLFFKSDSSNPYEDTTWGRFSGTCDSKEAPLDNYGKDHVGCDYSVPKNEIPTFKKVNFPFTNEFDNTKTLPLMACAMVDLDNDGIDEVFVGGGINQQDAIFKYRDNGFVDVSKSFALPNKPAMTKTLGATSFDLDNDGLTDLLLSGDYGIKWLKNTSKGFEEIPIEFSLNDKSISATTTLGDFNKDGFADIFISAYIKLDKMEGQTIFKDPNYGASSILLQNNGDNTFTDVTSDVGLQYVHNTFQGVFVDIDNDSYLDLVVAYDTGEVGTYKNINGTSFKKMANPTTGKFAYPMGIAVGDYNNDGNIDFFFSNTGTSVPTFLARGDLEESDEFIGEWLLLKNNGDFNFTDVAKEAKVSDFEFSWGAIFEDFNLDGKQDLVVAENYVDFPPHKLFKLPGRFLIQRTGGTFAAVEDQAGVVNKNYAISPLTSDFNLDGYPDLIFSNLAGPVQAFINNGGDSNYISIRFAEQSKNLGARVTVQLTNGEKLTDVYVIGEGLSSDQTATLTFGLGSSSSVKAINIEYPSGQSKTIASPEINKTHYIN